jgi:V8-like Glu-specific endopeptidase
LFTRGTFFPMSIQVLFRLVIVVVSAVYRKTLTTEASSLYRIVGGSRVSNGDFPFFAYPSGSKLCGATLIHGDILISAAHCGPQTWSSGLWLGGSDILNTADSIYYPISKTVVHPNYTNTTNSNDIMLIKINGFSVGPYAQLNYNRSIPADGQELTAIGYGKTSETGSISFTLQQVNLFAESHENCSKHYNVDDEIMICNGGIPEGGKDTCQGDSGGPLFLSGTTLQVATVSFGRGCARPGIPAVNARISAYESWIQSSICSLSSKPPTSCPTLAPITRSPIKPAPIKPAPVKPAPVKPTPVKPTPIKPTPIKPTPIKPTPIKPTPIKPTPVKPTPTKPVITSVSPPAPAPVKVAIPVATTAQVPAPTIFSGTKSVVTSATAQALKPATPTTHVPACVPKGGTCRFNGECCGPAPKCTSGSIVLSIMKCS